MPTFHDAFDAVRTALSGHASPTPAEFEGLVPFERMVAVLLERGVAGVRWKAALDSLDEGDLVSPERLAQAEIPEIADALREKGISTNARAIAPLKHLARFIVEKGEAGIESVDEPDPSERPVSVGTLRDDLSALKGIGPATADAIILFALKRPSYPVDRASFRAFVRHGWLDSSSSYDEARDLVVEAAMGATDEHEEPAVRVLGDLSHALAQLGRQFCRASAPRCQGCPLEHLLPEGGPREVDA